MTSGYEAARSAAAFLALPERGVLAVTGPDRQKFLHNLLSNDVMGRGPGEGCLAALMNVKGHLLALMRVLVTKDAVLLEMPLDRLQPVEDLLGHYRVAAPVRFAVKPASVVAILGPSAREVLARTGLILADLSPEAHACGDIAGSPVLAARASDLPCGSFALQTGPQSAAAVLEALAAAGATALDRSSFDALRVEEGRPLYGVDVTEENLLHETGLLGSYHSPTKGCYVGQEVVARLEARGGNVNKMLRGLRLEGPVEAGTPIRADGREVGRVTTAALSPRLGAIGLGYVHRAHAAPGTAVDVAGRPATVTALPMSV